MDLKVFQFILLSVGMLCFASAQEQAVFEVRPSTPADEGSTVQACVRLLNIPESAVEVVVNSQENAPSDSATSGVDYAAISTSLQFIQSSAEQCVDISIFEDGALEGIEFFTVSVSSNDAVLTSNSGVVIINDATIVEFGFAEPTYTISEGTINSMVCVNLIDSTIVNPASTITVTLTATQGTATANADYVEPSVSFTFNSNTPPSGECVIINIIDDVIVEDQEMFILSIEASAGGAISPGLGTAEVTITDNDGVSVSFDSTELSVVEGNTGMFPSVDVCVSVSPPAGGRDRNVLVNLNTQEGSAGEDDFQSLNTTLTFGTTMNQLCEPVTVIGDDTIEGDHSFYVVGAVANAQDSFTGSNQVTVTILGDSDECPTLNNPMDGQVQMNGTTANSTATYTCDEGFQLSQEASGGVTCTLDIGWYPVLSETICAYVCPMLEDPDDGEVQLSGTIAGSTATYTCNEGFELSDEAEGGRTCTRAVGWSPALSDIICSSASGVVVSGVMMLIALCTTMVEMF